MTANSTSKVAAEPVRQPKPPVNAFDPFSQLFKPERRADQFGEMFQHKIINDDF